MALFISFEGIDGCGKSTHITLLEEYLQELGYDTLQPREPGGTPIGEKIRTILLEKTTNKMTAETELLLFLASRAQIVRELIKPALAEENKVVICDRFMDSSVAYQGYGRDLGADRVNAFNQFATRGLEPDITFLLDVEVEEAQKRLGLRSKDTNRLDEESQEFMCKVRQGFLCLAEQNPDRIKVIDTSGDRQTAQAQIREYLRRYLK